MLHHLRPLLGVYRKLPQLESMPRPFTALMIAAPGRVPRDRADNSEQLLELSTTMSGVITLLAALFMTGNRFQRQVRA